MRTLPKWLARQVREALIEYRRLLDAPVADEISRLVEDFDKHLSPKRGQAERKKVAKSKKAERREKTASVRAPCLARSGNRCEACGMQPVGALQLDHFWGGSKRRSGEAVESCWMLCATCHQQKTDNVPTRACWLERFAEHCGAVASNLRARCLLAEANRYVTQGNRALDERYFVGTKAALDSMRTGVTR